MRVLACFAALLASACVTVPAQAPNTQPTQPDPNPLLATARKLLVVTTDGWDSVPGTLRTFERRGERWQPHGAEIAVVVGKNGMGWDRRVPSELRDTNGPIKREGDGRSPAGVFRLLQVFGYAPRLPGSSRYLPLTGNTECVDDPASRHYGQVLERTSVTRVDWNSSEQMRRDDDLYRLGVIVDYDVSDVIHAGGSCIFLHIWRGAGQGTAGCTAMAPDHIEMLVAWLGNDTRAVIVQLPRSEYVRLAGAWRLP